MRAHEVCYKDKESNQALVGASFFIIFSKNNMDEAPVGDAFILVILLCASHSSG
jgi:hypothetical protein